MAEQKSWNSSKGSTTVWVATVLVALAIIGVSVYLATSRAPSPGPEPSAVPATPREAVQPARPVAPAPQPERQAETEQPSVTSPPPAVTTPPEPDYDGPPRLQLNNLAGTLELSVPFMAVRNKMPLKHTCFNVNASPALNWEGAPTGTRSLVVFLERRTVDGNEPFLNWALFNIPGEDSGLPENMPRSATLGNGARHALSDHDNVGYIGPCEALGEYTYALRVFALDTMLDLAAGAHKYELIRAMNGHIIDAAEQEFIHYKRL